MENDLEDSIKQQKQLDEMAENNRRLFDALGISEHELDLIMNDRSLHSPEVWEILQNHREKIEETIDQKIKVKKKEAKTASKINSSDIQPHWIPVR